MAKDLKCSVNDLVRDAGLRQKIQLPKYVTESVGLPTLNDMSKSTSTTPGELPTVSASAGTYWKFGASALIGQ